MIRLAISPGPPDSRAAMQTASQALVLPMARI